MVFFEDNSKLGVSVKLFSAVDTNTTEVAINYAEGKCISIDFNKSSLLRASVCTCGKITGGYPQTHTHSFFSLFTLLRLMASPGK